jgi:hypothetical protein
VFRGERPLYPVQGAKAPPNSGNTAVGLNFTCATHRNFFAKETGSGAELGSQLPFAASEFSTE